MLLVVLYVKIGLRKCARYQKKNYTDCQMRISIGTVQVVPMCVPYSKVNEDELQYMFISDKINQNKCDLFKKCREIELEFFKYK